jgi:hypothetical protein
MEIIMNEDLIQYLSDEYIKCVREEEEIVQRKYELECEQRKFEENLYFHIEDEKRRQLFSPLIFNDNHQLENSHEEFQKSKSGKELQDCETQMKVIDDKKKQLKGFIHSLSDMSAKVDDMERKSQLNQKKDRRKRKRK